MGPSLAAGGRLYLTTVDGKVLCLGGEGTQLPEAPITQLAPLDISVKPLPPLPKPKTGPSAKGDFAKVIRADVTQCKLGYHLRADGKKTGLALKKLPKPLKGNVTLKARLKSTPSEPLRNGFLVFGHAPEEAGLVKCGLRFLMGKAVIVEGAISSGKVADKALYLDLAKTYELDVTVDLASGQVTMKTNGATLTAKLDHPPASISYVGYETLNAATDFSPIQVSGK